MSAMEASLSGMQVRLSGMQASLSGIEDRVKTINVRLYHLSAVHVLVSSSSTAPTAFDRAAWEPDYRACTGRLAPPPASC